MKVTQEKLPASQIGLEIEITPEITKQTYEQVIKKLATTTNIPGFRKGKVPRQILLQRLGVTRIKATALEELIQNGIEQALKQEAILAIGQPRLLSSFEDLISNYQPGQPLTISASVDVEPEVNLLKYTELQAKAEEVKFDPARVESVLEKQRTELATLIPVEGRAAQIGDIAVVDFKGVLAKGEGEDETAEPTPIPGAEASDFQVELQEDKFIIPGFVTGMVGLNPGETKEISVQFPDPYANQELAGKPAIFTVTLKELKEKELPELNDDFAQEVSDFDTLEELRSSLEEKYQKEAQEKTKSNQQEALLAELLAHTEVELPETLIEQEVDNILRQIDAQLTQQGLDFRKFLTQELIVQWRERSRGEATERLKRSFGLREVAKRESIELTDEQIQARVTEILQEYPDQEIDLDRVRSVVENELLVEKIFDWLLAHSTVELVPEGSLKTEETADELSQSETDVDVPQTEEQSSENTPESTEGQ